MKPVSASRSRSKGQALIEFMLIFPMLFLLIVNAINFGAFFFSWITVANAARAGASYWVLGSAAVGAPTPATPAQVTTLVTNDISSLLNRTSLVVRVCKNNNGSSPVRAPDRAPPSVDPEPPTYVSASVDVTYTFQPPIQLFTFANLGIHTTLPSTTIHRQATMRVLQ